MTVLQDVWTPLNEDMIGQLHSAYCGWIDNLTEIRTRMSALRKAVAGGWKPDAISESNLNRLNANDEWNAHHNVENARTVLLCAEYEARKFFPDRRAQIEREVADRIGIEKNKHKSSDDQLAQFDRRLNVLRSLWQQGWRPFGENRQVSRAAIELHDWCNCSGRPFAFGSWPAAQIDLWLCHYEDQTTPQQSLRLHLIEMLKTEKAKRIV